MRILNSYLNKSLGWSVILASFALTACGGSNANNDAAVTLKKYRVTISNVTANQPFSHAAIILHRPSYHIFQPGQAASVGLEYLAEGGSNSQLMNEARSDAGYLSSESGSSEILPGKSEIIDISVNKNVTDLRVSVASMLVNTNDAFAGVTSNKISGLEVGESFAMHIPVWDSGTEINDEAASTIPGPAGGGSGFDASREGDSDLVAIHSGVVTNADGFATSVLDESHRFNNPVGLLRVKRVK